MTDYGPCATVDTDDDFHGEFDDFETEVIIEVMNPIGEFPRYAIRAKPDWGEELDDGHALGCVVEETGLVDKAETLDIYSGVRVVVTTDGFDRATRTYNPLTREGEATAIGRSARVLTTRRWADELAGKQEAEAEARLDRQRERSFDRNGH